MSAVFLKILNMSIAGVWPILALLLLRPLIKKAPRQLLCLLWALAAIRLLLPFTIKSPTSLIPSANTVPQSVARSGSARLDTGFPELNTAIASAIENAEAPSPAIHEAPAEPTVSYETAVSKASSPASRRAGIVRTASVVWACGVSAAAAYGLISYLLLRRRVRASIETDGRRICDEINSPFILGVFRPRIYVPSSLRGGDLDAVLSHERAHIARGDHILKPLGFALLCVHWFNPLVWIGYALFCRDIETACDERVIRDMEREERASYSEALMRLSSPRTAISACPVAFGEVSVKSRIKNVLSYKKPAFWVLIVGALLVVTLGAVFLTDPIKTGEARAYCVLGSGSEYRVDLSEAASKKLSKLISKKRLNENGRRMGGWRIMLGNRELSYDSETGTLYEPAKKRYAVLDDKTRRSVNDILGVGCVTETQNPFGNRYRIRPLLALTTGSAPRIELEISTFENTELPYYASLFREAPDGSGPKWLATLSRNFGSFFIVDGSMKTDFDLDPKLIAEAGTYYLCMYDGYDPAFIETHAVTEFSDRYIAFTVSSEKTQDGTLRLYKDAETLKNDCPDYAELDTKKGVDVYVFQLARGHYACLLMPGGWKFDTMELMTYADAEHILTVEDARTLIDSYAIPSDKVNIVGWHNPVSSYWYSITPAYNAMFRRMLFPEEGAEGTTAPEGTNAPQAFSLNTNARLTVAAWDFGDGAHYAEGYSEETVKLPAAPSIAVTWENIGSGMLEFGSTLAMEYLPDDGDPVPVKSAETVFYNDLALVVMPGGVRTEVYSLSGFDMTEHGKYRLWLSVSFSAGGGFTDKLYYVDLYY